MKSAKYAMQPLAVAMAITNKNERAAMLFYDLWDYSLNSAKKNQGQKELILSDKQLGERTGLSFDQVRREKKFLVDNGYIKKRVKKDPKYHGNKTTTHIHIPDEVMALVEKMKYGTAQICTVEIEQNHISEIVQGCTLPIYIKEQSKSKAIPGHHQEGKLDCNDHQENQLTEKLKELFGHE